MKVLRWRGLPVFMSLLLILSMAIILSSSQGSEACGYTNWYLPEGYTGGNFDTYILLQNPTGGEAEATVRFMTDASITDPLVLDLEGNSRTTIKVDDQPGLANANVSTMVEASKGIIVERAMYFNYEGGKAGGSNSIGASNTSRTWYLAEGYTGGSFDTYILVMNPNDVPAHIKVKFITPKADEGTGREMNPYDPEPVPQPEYIEQEYDIPANRRFTIGVDGIPGLENTEVSAIVYSMAPEGSGSGEEVPGVVAERSMYFDYGGIKGGHCSIGAPYTSSTWYMAEGRTADRYDTYVLVMNPNDVPVNVKATFMVPGVEAAVEEDPEDEGDEDLDTTIVKEYQLEPYERFTIPVDQIEGLESTDLSTMIESSAVEEPAEGSGSGGYYVVAERAMYFSDGVEGDGHNSLGAMGEKAYWMMAEGYTGGQFDTWILIQNPNDIDVKVRVSFMTSEGGDPIVKEYTIAAKSRYTIMVDEIEGLEDAEVSTKIEVIEDAEVTSACENGVIAERAMYFMYNGIYGGHCSLGVGE
ncbi:MAG: hypothetical protein JW738_02100 [Actinobacteria bacterium]|nr:hypothetical protein [Actinomycetota bacterium]